MSDLYRYYDPDTRKIVRKDGNALGGTVGDDNATTLHFEYPRGFMDSRIAYIVFNVKGDNGNYLYYSYNTTPAFDGYSFTIPSNVLSRVTRNNLSYGLGFIQGANNNQGAGLPDQLAIENSIAQNLIISTFPPKPSEIETNNNEPIPTDAVAVYPDDIGIDNPTDKEWIEYLLNNSLMGVTYDEELDKFVFVTYSGHVWDVSVSETISIEEIRYSATLNLKQKLDLMDGIDADLEDTKVDKVEGKGLSTNDYTNEDKAKLDNVVLSVNGRGGDVVLTKADVGLTNVDNTSDIDKPVSTATQEALDAAAEVTAEVDAKVDAHAARTDNPHQVSKVQVGLGNADNTSDANKPISTATQLAIDELAEDIIAADTKINTHIADKANPHQVTKAQIGLGNVDNTSDLSKPISTATQEGLDAKVDISTKVNNHSLDSDITLTKADIGLGNVDNTADIDKPVPTSVLTALDGKVDKVTGKALSTNDYTTAEKTKLASLSTDAEANVLEAVIVDGGALPIVSKAVTIPVATTTVDGLITAEEKIKLAGIETGAQVNKVLSVAGRQGTVILTMADVGLGNVDNTSDANKPISIATQTALNGKVDAVDGMGLSSNDYTGTEKSKLAGIAAGAEVNINADWNATSGDAQILNKPTLGTASALNVGTASGNIPQLNSSGKIPDSTIPPLAIGEYKGEVETRDDLITLSSAQSGDIAKVVGDADVDNDGVYWLAGTYSDLTAWIQIVGPGSVVSVNGKTGVVLLAASDVGALSNTFDTQYANNYLKINADGSIGYDAPAAGISLSSDIPQGLGTASAGTAVTASRADHVHPVPTATDVGALPSTTVYAYSIGMSGRVLTLYSKTNSALATVTIPDTTYDVATQAANGLMSATDKIKLDGVAANADVSPLASGATPLMDGTGAAGTSDNYARADHKHPTDTSRASAAALSTHISDVANPHSVTKAQVGLGNVDNTSDAAKPVSALTQAAIDAEASARVNADDLKVSKAGDTMTGQLTLTGGSPGQLTTPSLQMDNALLIGTTATTSYTGIFNTRKCSGDSNNINVGGLSINADGSVKFTHRRGGLNNTDDAYIIIDGTKMKFAYGKAKGGTPVEYEVMTAGNVSATSPIAISVDSSGTSTAFLLTHAESGVTAGSAGGATSVPVLTVDSKGHVVALSSTVMYPPITAGTSGQYWQSGGSGRGSWQTSDTVPTENSDRLVTSGAVYSALADKVDVVIGKGLSTNDYTTAEKTKLSGISTGAQVNAIESVQKNGAALTVTDKTVNVTVPVALSEMTTDSTHRVVADTEKATWDAKATTSTYTATISASWTGTSAPYTQTVSVSGVLATDNPIVDAVLSSTWATAILQSEAWTKIQRIVTSANTLTVYATEATTTAIPIQIKVVR